MGHGDKGNRGVAVNMPDELKLPMSELNEERAAWLVVFSRSRRTKRGSALSLLTGRYNMFSGGSDAERQRILSHGVQAYEANFTVSLQAEKNKAEFEAKNPKFVAAAKAAADWAKNN